MRRHGDGVTRTKIIAVAEIEIVIMTVEIATAGIAVTIGLSPAL